MNKFILIINGPMCSGKSTLTDLLLKKIPQSFKVSSDKIRWQIANYSSDIHRELVSELAFSLAKKAAENGLSLIIDGTLVNKKIVNKKYQKLAKKLNYKFIEIKINASWEVIRHRFQERVKNAKLTGNHISCTTLKRMKEIYNRYMTVQTPDIPTFDSDKISPEKLCQKILKLLKITLSK